MLKNKIGRKLIIGIIILTSNVTYAQPIHPESNIHETVVSDGDTLTDSGIDKTWNDFFDTDEGITLVKNHMYFSDTPKIINHFENPGTIYVEVITDSGEILYDYEPIRVGHSLSVEGLDCGERYTIKARGVVSTKKYIINIK